MNEFIAMWKNYANFNDKTTRRGYWMAFLFNMIAALVIGFIAGMLKLQILTGLYSLAVLIPSLAITVRRLHDVGKNGIYILISLIPIVGGILLLIQLVKPSQEGFEGSNEIV